MNYRKANRDRRNRTARMIKTKPRLVARMDRERKAKLDRGSDRYGSEGLSCPFCAPGVHGKLNKQTRDGRAALSTTD